ncbi:tripartite tricarboxylate transporter substrate binding protein [Halorubrum luteum]
MTEKDNLTVVSRKRRQFLKTSAAGAAVGLAGCLGGGGEGEYPNQPLRFIIPFSQGGGTDTIMRQLAPALSDVIGQDIEIDNIPGGGSMRGTEELVRADPDGYTFGGFNPPGTVSTAVVDDPGFDITSLQGIAMYTYSAQVIHAHADHDVEDLDDLFSRYESGEFELFAGDSLGGSTHITAEILNDFGLEYDEFIPYDGGGPTAEAIASGEVPAGIATADAARGFIDSGDIDPIATGPSEPDPPSPILPDVPSSYEYDQIEDSLTWASRLSRCMFFPEGVEQDKIEFLTEAVEEALQDPDYQEWAEESGTAIEYGGPDVADDALQGPVEEMPERLDMDDFRERVVGD